MCRVLGPDEVVTERVGIGTKVDLRNVADGTPLTVTFLGVEVVAGLLTGSLALLADAGHMLTDVAGLVLALAAMKFAERPPSPRRTYGYHRVEILAALTNGLVLLGVAGYILMEAWDRGVFCELGAGTAGLDQFLGALKARGYEGWLTVEQDRFLKPEDTAEALLALHTRNREWLAEEPDLAAHEAACLGLARRAGVCAPELVAFDGQGNLDGVPATLMTRLPGAVDLVPDDLDDWLYGLAEAILPLHSLEAARFPWRYAQCLF